MSGRVEAVTPPPAPVDVLVVGGGPAGLSAALVLGRSRRRVLLVDDGQPRNAAAHHVHGYLGADGSPPGELLRRGREEAARYGVELRTGRVTTLVPGTSTVRARLADDVTVEARRVVVATGLRDELPDVPGLAERWGRDVLHCPYCHGWEVRDRRLAVLACAPAEVGKALTVRQWSADVVLVLHGMTADDVDPTEAGRLRARGVEVVEGTVAGLEVADDRLTAVLLADGGRVACDALVVQPTVVARDDLLAGVGAEVHAGDFGEFAVTDGTGATGVPGVWAAGNVTEPLDQVVMAAAAGYRAALAVDHDLVLEDADRAVAALGDDVGVQRADAAGGAT